MYVAREIKIFFKVILIFQKQCYVIQTFPELYQNIGNIYIIFPISSSSRAVEWIK